MRRSVLTYWIITVGVIIAANQLVASSDLFRRKTQVVDRKYAFLQDALESGDNFTLLLGNSYVAAALPVDSLPDHVVPFVEFGMPFENMVQIVEHLPESSSIDAIIVGLGYNYANQVASDAEMYKVHFETNPVARMWWSIPLVRGRTLAVTIVKNWLTCIASGVGCGKRESRDERPDESGQDPSLEDAGIKAAQDMEASIRNRLRQYRPLLTSISARFGTNVARMKSASDRRGIEFHAFTAPIHPRLREQLDASVLEDFASMASGVDPGYVDLNTIATEWQGSYFHDGTHVNERGASEVLRALSTWIR